MIIEFLTILTLTIITFIVSVTKSVTKDNYKIPKPCKSCNNACHKKDNLL